jgi:hypothetical protein
MEVIEAAAPSLGVPAIVAPVRASADIEPAMASFPHQPNSGLMLLASGPLLPAIDRWRCRFCQRRRLDYSTFMELVGQFRQGSSLRQSHPQGFEAWRPAGAGAGQIQARHQLKTAKSLGLTAPLPLLGLADEVIQ